MSNLPIEGQLYPKTQQNLENAPAAHGVYELYQDGTLIYIGRASGGGVTIRSRLQAHARGDDGPCTRVFTHYKREVTEYAIRREQELLEEHNRRYGRLPRCNERVG